MHPGAGVCIESGVTGLQVNLLDCLAYREDWAAKF